MRILQIETFGRGGLIHYAYNLSCALADRHHEVTLVTAAAYELDGRPLSPGVRLVKSIARTSRWTDRHLPGFAARWVRRVEAIVDVVRLTAFARRLRPDVIHLHCTNPVALLYLTFLRRLRVPLVATAHVVTPHERTEALDRIYARIHRAAPTIIAHSDVDRRRLQDEFSVDPERVVVIPHGEYGFFERDGQSPDRDSARRSLGLEPADEVALFFGYIREYKGVDVLLDAWKRVREARERARLVVAGDPVRLSRARRNELEAWANRVGAVSRFEYIPFSDVPRYFAAADVLVMPYRHISQSGVLFLALSLGVPVVATTVGALPEVLRDGESALLVPPEDSSSLARAIERLLGDATLRAELTAGGRDVAEAHSWSSIAERCESLYASASSAKLE